METGLAYVTGDCVTDVIRANDIFTVYLNKGAKLGIHFIYDKHEYRSRSIVYQYLQNDSFRQSLLNMLVSLINGGAETKYKNSISGVIETMII